MQEMRQSEAIRTWDGLNLYLRKDVPRQSKGLVVILHALGEHGGCYEEVSRALNAAGYGVYRFDSRGHGRSDGPRGDIQDFRDYISDTDLVVEQAHAAFPRHPLFLLGYGMGGLVAASYAAAHPNKVDGEITVGAALRMMPALEFLHGSGFTHHRERGDERFSLIMPQGWGRNMGGRGDDRFMLDSVTVRLAGNVWFTGADWFAQHMKDVVTPVLILHGEDDSLVPPESSQWFYAGVSSQDRSLRVYPKSGHIQIQEGSEVLADVLNWLDMHGRTNTVSF